MNPPKTIDELIQGLDQLTTENIDSKDILRAEVTKFMNSYEGDDWQKYAFWDEVKYWSWILRFYETEKTVTFRNFSKKIKFCIKI